MGQLAPFAIMTLVGASGYLYRAEAAGGFSCFGQPRSSCNVEHPWKEAFEMIDQHLSAKIHTNELDANLHEVENLLVAENKATTIRGKFVCDATAGQSAVCISRRMKSKDKEVVKKALFKLLDLEHQDCLVATSHNLAELNEVAMNPIGRLYRGNANLMPRVDLLIFNAALERAMKCLPEYRGQLLRTSTLSGAGIARIKFFWDQILEQRLRTLHGDLGQVFKRYPARAIHLVRTMPNAIEWDEMYIAQANLKYGVADPPSTASANRSVAKEFDFERTVRAPCSDYMYMVSGIFQSLDFDLQLLNCVPTRLIEQSEFDDVVNRHRAYYLMCEKALQQETRFNDILADLGGSRRSEYNE